jgi:hypothetical protein
MKIIVPLALLILASGGTAKADQAKTDVMSRMDSAAKTLQEITNAPDKGIPNEVLEGAKCIAVIPSMLKLDLFSAENTAAVLPRVGSPMDAGARQRSLRSAVEVGERRLELRTFSSS